MQRKHISSSSNFSLSAVHLILGYFPSSLSAVYSTSGCIHRFSAYIDNNCTKYSVFFFPKHFHIGRSNFHLTNGGFYMGNVFYVIFHLHNTPIVYYKWRSQLHIQLQYVRIDLPTIEIVCTT